MDAAPLPATAHSRSSDDHGSVLQEVCRCAVYGGVGLLSLHKQCSIVAFSGVQRRTTAARLQLADVSQSPPSTFFLAKDPSTASRTLRPWPAEEDAAVREWYEGWRASAFANGSTPPSTVAATLAYVECPSTIAALRFSPHVIVAASSGDPKIAGSHTLYVFDHHLQPVYTLPVYPPTSNAYLNDMIAIAAVFTSSNGAGMVVQRLRVMLPGEKKGEVRLLTLKKSTLTATTYDPAVGAASFPPSTHGSNGKKSTHGAPYTSGVSHRLVDRVLHQAPLRAVAITEDGRSGVTMSSQGMRLRLLDFVGDDIITERLSLDRGRLPAVTDTVSLAITPVPQPGAAGHGSGGGVLHLRTAMGGDERHERCSSDSGVATGAAEQLPNRQYQLLTETLHDIVVCLTSSGTLHVFGCGLQQVLFYHSNKTLLPRVGYPFAFSLCLPSQLMTESGAALFVARSDVSTSAAHYLPRRQRQLGQRGGKMENADVPSTSEVPTDFFAFQLRYSAGVTARETRDTAMAKGDASRSSVVFCCSLAT
jgi:hypothetical protein